MKRASRDAGSGCPCGSGQGYRDCCEPLHRGVPAPDAVALMRSRYCAYALGLDDYLLSSWHPSTRPATLSPNATDAAPTWLGLTIKRRHSDDETHASVEFVARYRVGGGSAARLHELSRFVREAGRWYYLDGTYPAATPR